MTSIYEKTVLLGYAKGDLYGYKRALPVEIDVEIREEKDGSVLSICGTIWTPRRSDAVVGGQCYGTIAKLFPDDPKVQRIIEVWKRWHLNGMRAGCEHQRAEKWVERPIDPTKPLDAYGIHFEGQRSPSSNRLTWVRPEERPDGLLTAPCPACGYHYGTRWLYEPLPEEIIEEVKTW